MRYDYCCPPSWRMELFAVATFGALCVVAICSAYLEGRETAKVRVECRATEETRETVDIILVPVSIPAPGGGLSTRTEPRTVTNHRRLYVCPDDRGGVWLKE